MLAQVLLEFVQAPYAKRLIEEGDVQPLIGAPSKQLIGIVFESVKLNDNRLEVRLKRNFEQRSERLLGPPDRQSGACSTCPTPKRAKCRVKLGREC